MSCKEVRTTPAPAVLEPELLRSCDMCIHRGVCAHYKAQINTLSNALSIDASGTHHLRLRDAAARVLAPFCRWYVLEVKEDQDV